MIPVIVTSTLKSIAKDVLKKWGLQQVDDLANNLFNIRLKTDAKVDRTNEQLKEVTAQLGTIINNITKLSSTITKEFLGVKVDLIEAQMVITKSLYHE
jgi:predicted PurR-regulated permease PerM